MDFGLGLVLSFTDNATAGINNAVNSLSQLTSIAENATSSLNQMASLSALSVVSNQLGSSFLKAGSSILGVFSSLLGKVKDTGSDFESFRITLNALYGDAGKAENAIEKLLDFSIKSPFEVSEVKDMLIVLQSQSIDAFEQIKGSITGTRQETLSWIADLMAFKPDIAKDRWKLAITNFIGSGADKMLRNILDMGKIEDILGHEVGDTVEERMNDLIEIVENKNLTGLAEKLSLSWQGVASNISDAFTKIYKSIADNGVFDNLKASMMSVSGAILTLDNKQLETFGKTIAEALNIILTPLTKIASKFNDFLKSVIDLCQTNPELVKFATVGVVIAGVLLVLAGVALKVTSAMSGLSLMLLTMGKSFGSIGSIIKTGALKMLSTLLPLTATIALLSLAWKSDLAGIRTNVTYFVNGVSNSFKTARQAVDGSVADLTNTLTSLRDKGDFFSNLTIGIMEVMVLFEALADVWSDNTLSEDTFLKAKELGILPLIEAILDLKYRFGFFKDGFIAGWKEIGDKIKSALSGFVDSVQGTFLEDIIDNLTTFLQKLASGDTDTWYDFGQSFAEFTAKAVAFWAVFKVVGSVVGTILKVVGVFKTLWTVIKTVGSAISSLGIIAKIGGFFTKFGGIIMTVLGAIGTVVTAILGFFGIVVSAPAWVVGAITVAIIAIIGLIVAFWDEISAFFSTIGSWIYDNVIKPVADFFVGLWNGIVTGVTTAVDGIKNFFSTIASWIYNNIIAPVVNFFTTYIFPIISKIVEIVMKIVEIIVVLVSVFVQWVYNNVIQPIINFFVGLWNKIVEGVTAFVNKAKEILGIIGSWIYENIISPVAEFFVGLWNGIVEGITSFIENAKVVFGTIVTWIKTNIIDPIANFFSGLWEGIKTTFDVIADTISSVLKGAVNTALQFICNVINGVIKGINWAIDVINAIPGVSITKIDLLELPKLAQGGVIESPTVAMIGEAGTEAVMPLENNTGWIGKLASMISTQMESIRPANTSQMTTNNQGDTNQKYLTNNSTINQTYQGDTDNSVVFNQGAIQVTVQNATEEEAIRLAKMVMEYIKRQKELDRMMTYA